MFLVYSAFKNIYLRVYYYLVSLFVYKGVPSKELYKLLIIHSSNEF